MKKLLLASAATVLFAVPAIAQESDPCQSLPDEAAGIDDCHLGSSARTRGQAQPVPVVPDGETNIVVLGEGLPDTPATPAYSTIELERDQIVSTASGRLEDALASVAGFQQFRRSDSRSSNPSAQGATLRALGGNATSRALILLDGVPIADPFFGYIPFSGIDPSRIDSIRVTRGGGSGPFGAGALAGTIELTSADATSLGLFSASAFGNDREETELSASIAPEIGTGFAVVSGRWDRGQGFYTTPEDQRVAATARAAFDAWSVGGRLVQRVGDLEVQARALLFDDRRTLRFEGADNSSEGQDVSLRVVSRGPWQVDALAYGQWRNFTNVVISSTAFTRTLDQKDTPSEGQGAKFEVRPPVGGDHTLRLGADFRRSAGDLFEDAYNAGTGALTQMRFAGGENRQFGLFLEDDWQLGPVVLTGGVRADRYTIADGYFRRESPAGAVIEDNAYPDRSDWEVTWRAGALVQANEAVSLRAAAYTGFRLPTLNELYRPFVVFPVTTQANENLLPERLEGWEVGLDITPAPGMVFSATWFDNRVKDAIANVTVGPNLRRRENLDAIDAQGVEFAARVHTGGFSFDATAQITDAEVVGTGAAATLDGNVPAQTPEFAASATASYRFPGNTLVSATLRHVGDQFEGDQEDDLLPSATTLDLFASVPIVARLSAVARIENAFDEEVVTRNQAGSMDLGAPRTVWLGLRWGY